MKRRLACGGLWLISDFLNETTGFEGHGVHGWDPRKKAYVGTWVDTMRTFLGLVEGSYDPAARAANGISDGLIRLSIGLEAFEDLRADLDAALTL